MTTASDTDSADWLPPAPTLRRRTPAADDADHPLLAPLAEAQDAVARLEASVAVASPGVIEGLRARVAFREAAGWLGHSHTWLHPRDLALTDAGLTGGYTAAALSGRLGTELPTMTAQGVKPDVVPFEDAVSAALRLARLWRRLAEYRTWRPIANAAAGRETLASLGWPTAGDDDAMSAWLALVSARDRAPALIRAARGARDWMNRQSHADPLSADGVFLAACLWRQAGFGRDVPLPFWSAPAQLHHRLTLQVGAAWLAAFLVCVAAAARAARDELAGLQQAEAAGIALGRTARSHLPHAVDHVLRTPVVTARTLANSLSISPQAALSLIGRLVTADVLREATGRAAWRAFTTP